MMLRIQSVHGMADNTAGQCRGMPKWHSDMHAPYRSRRRQVCIAFSKTDINRVLPLTLTVGGGYQSLCYRRIACSGRENRVECRPLTSHPADLMALVFSPLAPFPINAEALMTAVRWNACLLRTSARLHVRRRLWLGLNPPR